jgi:hypothetical protein
VTSKALPGLDRGKSRSIDGMSAFGEEVRTEAKDVGDSTLLCMAGKRRRRKQIWSL